MEQGDIDSLHGDDDDDFDTQAPPTFSSAEKRRSNTKSITNIALASLRHHTGLRETAEISTAAWIDAGLITETDTTLVINHNKVKRAQDKMQVMMQKLG